MEQETSISPQEFDETDNLPIICSFHNWTMPAFPGGQTKMLQFIAENFEWPKSLNEDCCEGIMVVQFTVELDGSISEPKIVKSIHTDLEAICIGIVKKMPKWIPGSLRGVPTRIQMNLPIRIHLE
jgi:hypothetical protein